MLVISLVIYWSGLQLDVILEIYGSVLGFIYIILLPVCLHLYCVLYRGHSGWIRQADARNLTIMPN